MGGGGGRNVLEFGGSDRKEKKKEGKKKKKGVRVRVEEKKRGGKKRKKWFKTYHFAYLRCLLLEICYPPLPLPLGKHIFREKKKHNKYQKVKAFYCLRTSFRTKHRNSTQIKCSMKSLLIYININNLITTKNCEPIFTKRPTISKQSATLLTKES